ncbi:MAG: hypothetical protein EAX95_12655 [Candidatus Thorarchaeota archaeon]|nr:hypothetical protein [Candidatus Thorarchaeota archaeon]
MSIAVLPFISYAIIVLQIGILRYIEMRKKQKLNGEIRGCRFFFGWGLWTTTVGAYTLLAYPWNSRAFPFLSGESYEVWQMVVLFIFAPTVILLFLEAAGTFRNVWSRPGSDNRKSYIS